MKSSTAKLIAGLLFTPVLAFAGIASAQVMSGTSFTAPNAGSGTCTTLTHGLYVGSRDAWTAGDVTALQNFLYVHGNLSVASSGYFGLLTQGAVRQFQASVGISTTGFVGPLTRAAIQNLTCGTTRNSGLYIQSLIPNSGSVGSQVTIYGAGFTGDNTVIFGSGAIVHVSSNNGSTLTFTVPSALNPLCYYSGCMMPSRETTPGTYNVSVQNARGTTNAISFTVTGGTNTPVTIYSITPTSGPAGTSVSITGFGFTNTNTVHIGGGAIGNVPISSSIAIACTTNPSCHGGINQTLTITIPSSIGPYCPAGSMCPMYMQLLTPGTYTIYVQNDNGTSNSVSFTITGSSSNQGPSVTGIDAPATLALGSTGTWTVHTLSNAVTANLHYSVNWGDQQVYAASGIMASPASPSQSSATFTHAYSQAGTYTAIFTVSDDSNNSSTVSSTITVTSLY